MHFILHMGPAKTGTTAVQKWLLSQSDALAQAGVLYSRNGCGARGNFGALATALLGRPPSGRPDDPSLKLSGFRADLAAFGGDRVLISSEALSDLMLRKEKGLSPRLGPKRVAAEVQTLSTALWTLGARRMTAVVVLRSEGDRAVSRVAQAIQGFQQRPIEEGMLPPPVDYLLHSHDFFVAALEAQGFEIVPVLYQDSSDPRPLGLRILDRAGIATDHLDQQSATKRANVSTGVAGCIAALQIRRVILDHVPARTERMRFAAGRGKACFRTAYALARQNHVDTSFNGVGPARVAEVLKKQAPKNRVYRPYIGRDAIEGLNQSKWTDRPMSPLTPADLTQAQTSCVAAIMDAFAAQVHDLPRARAIYGNACIEAFDRMAPELLEGVAP